MSYLLDFLNSYHTDKPVRYFSVNNSLYITMGSNIIIQQFEDLSYIEKNNVLHSDTGTESYPFLFLKKSSEPPVILPALILHRHSLLSLIFQTSYL